MISVVLNGLCITKSPEYFKRSPAHYALCLCISGSVGLPMQVLCRILLCRVLVQHFKKDLIDILYVEAQLGQTEISRDHVVNPPLL